MIVVACVGCGRTREVSDEFAGQRVSCARCGAETIAPAADTVEVDVSAWFRVLDTAADLETASVEVTVWTSDSPR
jgi:hypothetical protein